MANQIQLRHDTSANWASVNPILAQGEVGIDVTLNKIKVGDGTTAWTSLAWQGESSADYNNSAFNTQVRTSQLDQMAAPTSAVGLNGQKATDLAAPTAGSNDAARIVDVENATQNKQATLVSGTNIKTINGQTLLGSGDIVIETGSIVESERVLYDYLEMTDIYDAFKIGA